MFAGRYDNLITGVKAKLPTEDVPKRHKYGAVRTEVDGHKFASKAEAERYVTLKACEEAGDIRYLRLQPRYELAPKETVRGQKLRAITYVADFEYFDPVSGATIVEDVKGVETAVFRMKANLFRRCYPELDFRLIRPARKTHG